MMMSHDLHSIPHRYSRDDVERLAFVFELICRLMVPVLLGLILWRIW